MVANILRKYLKIRVILPLLFLVLGLAAAAAIAGAPQEMLDAFVGQLRLSTLFPAAAPPVGFTGRISLAFAVGGGIALIGLVLRLAPRRRRATRLGATPPLRRADAHPDAPARRPIAAHSELGEPLPIVGDGPVPSNYEQPLPADLDQPLAAFDPDALPAERFETFPLPGAAEVASQPAASITALLERLERGATRRAVARGRLAAN